MLTALLLALQADAPSAVADALRKTLLLANPEFHALSAIRKTRAEKSFELTFEGAGGPGGAVINKKGSALRCAPGVLLLDLDTAKTKKTLAVRVGNLVQVYAPIQNEWMSPDEAGETGIAFGLTNPDDVLDLISKHAAGANFKGKDIELLLRGVQAVALANKLSPNQNWANARVDILLKRDAAGRIDSMDLDAAVNGAAAGHLTATFQFGRYGQVAVPAKMGQVPFNRKIQNAIAAHLAR